MGWIEGQSQGGVAFLCARVKALGSQDGHEEDYKERYIYDSSAPGSSYG